MKTRTVVQYYCKKCNLEVKPYSVKCSNCRALLAVDGATYKRVISIKIKERKFSNIISPGKFIFLSILSGGFYEIIWCYRNWEFIKEKEKLDIFPFWRAFFSIFFIYSLFKKILEYAKKEDYEGDYSSGWRTFFWIVLNLSSSYISGLLVSLTFLPLLSPLNAANFYYGQTEKNYVKRPLKWWHILLMILCALFWILIIYGLFLIFFK